MLVASPATASGEVGSYNGTTTCTDGKTLQLNSTDVSDGGGTFLAWHDTYSSFGGTRTSYKSWTTPGSHSNYTGQTKGNPWHVSTNYGHITAHSTPCSNFS